MKVQSAVALRPSVCLRAAAAAKEPQDQVTWRSALGPDYSYERVEKPASAPLAVLGAVGLGTAGAVAGGMLHGTAGAVAGGMLGLSGGALLGKGFGDFMYSYSIPWARLEAPSSAPPSPAQARVNEALRGEGTPSQRIAGVVKAAVDDMSAAEVKEAMSAKYRILRLLDREGNWQVPQLASHGATLLPDDVDGKAMDVLIDRMAQAAGQNPYLMGFLKASQGESFQHLIARVEGEGALVLKDAMVQSLVLERLTSLMAADHTLNEACREHWKAVADGDERFWGVQHLFETVKLRSVNLGLDGVNRALDAGAVSPNTFGFILPLNILEAASLDVHQVLFGDPRAREGHEANAQVGWELAIHGPQGAGPTTLAAETGSGSRSTLEP